MNTLTHGARAGLALGIAVTLVETALGARMMMHLGMPPQPATAATAGAYEIALGIVLGVLLAPLLRGGASPLLHLFAMTGVWIGLERFVAPDPADVARWLTGPVAGLVLVALGAASARLWRPLPWLIGMAALAAAIIIPVVAYEDQSHGRRIAAESNAPAGAPDVVVVVLDTVRAANLSTHGYGRPTAPNLERLASEGVLFTDATAPSTWSLPSHASLFTGRFPAVHKAHGESRLLDANLPTLAEILARHGYDTRCFTANPHISDGFGLTRGFAWSDRAWAAGAGGRSFTFIYRLLDALGFAIEDKGGAQVAVNFEAWAADRPDSGAPTFAFLNFLEAHFPYHQVPKAFMERYTDRSYRELRDVSLKAFGAQFGRRLSTDEIEAIRGPSTDMYDAGVAYSDDLLRRVVETLNRAGSLNRTLLVVLADHGEMLGEHGVFGHGPALYEPDLRVPLLFRYPPRLPAGLRVEAPVSTVGVFATVLELIGIEAPTRVDVGSLLPALAGRSAGVPVLAERFAIDRPSDGSEADLARPDRRYRTYRSGAWKLVETSTGDTYLFDLATDPDENANLATTRPDQRVALARELADWQATLGLPAIDAPVDAVPAEAPVDPAARERLRALGYVE